MITVEIEFEGIGIFYEKNKVWKALFPFDLDKCHNLVFSAEGGSRTQLAYPIPLAAPNRTLKLHTTQATSTTTSTNDFKMDMLNMSAINMHQYGLECTPYWYHHCVLLEIPHAELRIGELTNSKYRVESGDNQNTQIGKMGYAVSGKITLKDTGKIVLKDNSGVVFFDSTKHNETHYKLKFDNNCEGQDETDLDMLYRIVRDRQNPSRRFRIKRSFPGCFYFIANIGLVLLNLISYLLQNLLPRRRKPSHNTKPYELFEIPCYECWSSNPDDDLP